MKKYDVIYDSETDSRSATSQEQSASIEISNENDTKNLSSFLASNKKIINFTLFLAIFILVGFLCERKLNILSTNTLFNSLEHESLSTLKPGSLESLLAQPYPITNWTQFMEFITGPSPFKNETLAVRNKILEEALSTSTVLKNKSNKILIGISVAHNDFQRRHLIRAMQIHPYQHYGITLRFIVGSPREEYREALTYENQTYGDLIILKDFPDNRLMANIFKTYEFFKYVEQNMDVYKYVGKMDTDCFLNIPMFWKGYFNETVQELDLAIIAVYIRIGGNFDWPQGGFYVVSWKMMVILNRLHESVKHTSRHEDMQIGWYLYDAEIDYDKIEFPPSTAYDFCIHYSECHMQVNNETVRIHELKTDQDYLDVAHCFTPEGPNTTHINLMNQTNWKSKVK
jgi:hypothetical protein